MVVAGSCRDKRSESDELVDVPGTAELPLPHWLRGCHMPKRLIAHYAGMVISAFSAAGLVLYNDVALIRCIGTSSLYARNTYNSAAKMHPARLLRACVCFVLH